MVTHTFKPSTLEAEAGESVSLKPAWSIKGVPGPPGLHRETICWKAKQKNGLVCNFG